MKKGEIPWLHNESFEPHYFSFLHGEENQEKEQGTQSFEDEETLSFSFQLKDPF